jgi:hypothetical protein
MFRLPVSRIEVEFRQATGAEDMLLLEGDGAVVENSIALAERLARRWDGGDLGAEALPVTDLEALLLELRRRMFGDLVASRARCPVEACGTPTDVSFRISQYVAHHHEPVKDEPAWFHLRGKGVQFRLVTGADVTAAVRSPNPQRELERRTIRSDSPEAWGRARRTAQRAMEALAPPLSGEIAGRCPECGATARFWFDAQSYVQREMRYDAEFLYEDVHLLASRYHWTEEAILALPRGRRLQYVEIALRGAGGN